MARKKILTDIKFEYYKYKNPCFLDRILIGFRKLCVFPIQLYQMFWSSNMPPVCRFVPSCSEYSKHAILKYGFIPGVLKGAFRILRCNPFFKGGYDPLL